MAAPIIAAGAAVAARPVIESATDDQGLVNQAFKITILIGLALAIGFTVYIAYRLFPALSGLFDVFDSSLDAINAIATLPGTVFTFAFSATTLGRGLRNFRLFGNR